MSILHIKPKKPGKDTGFFLYRAATFFWKKSLNFLLVRKVSIILKTIFFFRFRVQQSVVPVPSGFYSQW